MNRRDWLARASWAVSLLGLGRHAAALAAVDPTAAAVSVGPADFKALVCVFLFGGNDANHMVLPLDAAALAGHRRARAAAGLAFDAAQLAALPDADGGAGGVTSFGLHPALAPLVPLWQRRQMALLFNTGPLVEPLTRSAYLARGARPDHLFSHADQQDLAQALLSGSGGSRGDDGAAGAFGPLDSGWGYRCARRLGLASAGAALPSLLSFDGNQRFLQGDVRAALALPARGAFGIGGGAARSGAGDAVAAARLRALRTMWADAASPIGRQAGDIVAAALSSSVFADPILNGAGTDTGIGTDTGSARAAAAFAPGGVPLDSALSRQLQRVARLLDARAAIGNRRQIFFVGMGGFDTHVNQARDLQRLYGELAAALTAFHAATEALGIAGQVTTFTLSDFARTLKANGSGGTDHGWGSHQIVIGGAVRGGRTYGSFPTLAAGGPDDAGSEGRWIPTTAHDQVAATLARWFGVDDDAGLLEVAPNLPRFATADIGFLA